MAATFQDIIDWKPPVDMIVPYNNLINALDQYFPQDWRSWKAVNLSYSELFGESLSSDTEKKLQFAVPTDDLIRCFEEYATSVGEQKFLFIKRQLTQWPIGRAIIWTPLAIVRKIHKGQFYSKFIETVKHLKPLLISRIDESPTFDIKKEECESRSGDESRDGDEGEGPPTKRSRQEDQIMDLIKEQNQMLKTIVQMAAKHQEDIDIIKQVITPKLTQLELNTNSSQDENRKQSDESQSLKEPSNTNFENARSSKNFDIIDFAPHIEIEPTISTPDPKILQQGIECQRLNSEQWSQIKYSRAQSQLEASPTFTSLKVNTILTSVTPRWEYLIILDDLDRTLAIVTHGLLQQQQCLQQEMDTLPPEVKAVLSASLLEPECEYAQRCGALVEYVRGRRAEVVAERRALYRPRAARLHRLLHRIPPSDTHLFKEPDLTNLIRRHGGLTKFFFGKSKPKNMQ